MAHQNTPNTTDRNTANDGNAPGGAQINRQNMAAQNTTTDFAQERSYWQTQLAKEPYYESGQQFSDFESAYQVGAEGRGRYADQKFEQAEPNLRNEWEASKGSTKVGWEKAKHAVRAAWNRVEDAIPGDSNKNGH